MCDADPITMAKYAEDNDLLNTSQWRQLKRYVKTGNSKYIRTVRVIDNLRKHQLNTNLDALYQMIIYMQ